MWKCPNCRFILQKCFLRASDGAVGINSERVREVCPNDGATLRPLSMIDWLICGGESGSNARPMHPDWARSLRDQCQDTGTPFFFKQWGEWSAEAPTIKRGVDFIHTRRDGKPYVEGDCTFCYQTMYRFGRISGRLLDGREWNEMPEVNHVTP
jgi:protein gp37